MTVEEKFTTNYNDEITVTRWAEQPEIWIGIKLGSDPETMLMELSTTDALLLMRFLLAAIQPKEDNQS